MISLHDRSLRFVTCAQYPNGTKDDRLVLEPLRDMGINVIFSTWNDPAVNWSDGRKIIIRSPWDYWEAQKEFLDWLTYLGDLKVQVYNPLKIIHWNLDKIYLSDIQAKGHAITPTQFFTYSGPEALRNKLLVELSEKSQVQSCKKWIVKPRISANAFKTYVINEHSLKLDWALTRVKFETFVEGEKLLIQPFLESVTEIGEWSLFYFWGQWSHTCLKTPATNDFRVQEEHGGFIREMKSDPIIRAAADRIAQDFASDLLYARIDLVLDQGVPRLMELEAIEPSLYLRMSENAPENFARALQKLFLA